ncbi:MAG: hypothetical protein Q9162_000257 [Coniocarpon cinnabarinum]
MSLKAAKSFSRTMTMMSGPSGLCKRTFVPTLSAKVQSRPLAFEARPLTPRDTVPNLPQNMSDPRLFDVAWLEGQLAKIRGPPKPPQQEVVNLEQGGEAPTFLGTTKRLPELNLADRVVLVSGGARGLGLVQAEALLEAGATVYCLDRLPDPSPYFTTVQARAKETLGANLHYRQIDIRDTNNLQRVIGAIADEHQRLDGLLACAGIQQEMPALEYNSEDANNMFAVNVTGTFMTAQATAKAMIKYNSPGAMAFIASMSGSVANRNLYCTAYNASKAGVLQLGRNLAAEWGPHQIRVNTISPGYIVTEMVEKLFETNPERRTAWASQNMLGRVSAPSDYRAAAVFLLSEASSFMTGSDLRIDGGHSAW